MAWIPCCPDFRILGRLPQHLLRVGIVLAAANEVVHDLQAAIFFRLVRLAPLCFRPSRIAALFVTWAEMRVPASEELFVVGRMRCERSHVVECVSAIFDVRSNLSKHSKAVGNLTPPTIIYRSEQLFACDRYGNCDVSLDFLLRPAALRMTASRQTCHCERYPNGYQRGPNGANAVPTEPEGRPNGARCAQMDTNEVQLPIAAPRSDQTLRLTAKRATLDLRT